MITEGSPAYASAFDRCAHAQLQFFSSDTHERETGLLLTGLSFVRAERKLTVCAKPFCEGVSKQTCLKCMVP